MPIREKPGGPAGPGCPCSPGFPVPGFPGKPGGPGGPRGPGFPGGPGSPFRSIGSSGRGISERKRKRRDSQGTDCGHKGHIYPFPTLAWSAWQEDKALYLFVKTTPRYSPPGSRGRWSSKWSSGHLGGFRMSSPRAPSIQPSQGWAMPKSLGCLSFLQDLRENGRQVAPAALRRARTDRPTTSQTFLAVPCPTKGLRCQPAVPSSGPPGVAGSGPASGRKRKWEDLWW